MAGQWESTGQRTSQSGQVIEPVYGVPAAPMFAGSYKPVEDGKVATHAFDVRAGQNLFFVGATDEIMREMVIEREFSNGLVTDFVAFIKCTEGKMLPFEYSGTYRIVMPEQLAEIVIVNVVRQ